MLVNNNFPAEPQMHCTRMRWGLDVTIPIVIIPTMMLLAAQGWFWTLGVFSIGTLSIIGFYFRNLRRKRTRFFFSWSICSYLFLLAVFQLEVIPILEILFVENLILMCFAAVMTLCAFMVRRQAAVELPAFVKGDDSRHRNAEEEWPVCEVCRCSKPPKCRHCAICGYCVLQQDHHCLWLDSCIGVQNQKYYMVALIALLASCWYYADLTLTTVCYPVLFHDLFLYPEDCSDVYGDLHVALCYVSAVYAIIIGVGAVLKLILQTWTMCRTSSSQDLC